MSASTTSAATRAWRAAIPSEHLSGERLEGFVVDLGLSSTNVVSDLLEELPEGPWRALHDYVLIDRMGNLREIFTVMTWSIEEELGCRVFAVVDGALRAFNLQVYCCEPYRVERRETVVANGLLAIADDDQETLGLLSKALAFYHRSLAEASQQRIRVADARIAAIPGACDNYGIGEDFQRAQDVLRTRVGAYGDALESEMLRVLTRFGALYREIRVPAFPDNAALAAFTAALDAFVIGCRLASFDRTLVVNVSASHALSRRGMFAALSAQCQTEMLVLVNTLNDLERALRNAAENQDWNDARLNAIEMRAAAAHIGHAHRCLQRSCISIATSR